MDDDLDDMTRGELYAEVLRLREAIRRFRSSDHPNLYKLVRFLPEENCKYRDRCPTVSISSYDLLLAMVSVQPFGNKTNDRADAE